MTEEIVDPPMDPADEVELEDTDPPLFDNDPVPADQTHDELDAS